MKNYIIGTLIVAVLVLSSIIYKNGRGVGIPFPVEEQARQRATDIEVPFYIYIFFSQRNCHDCLEVVQVLNGLPPHFIVTGVAPDHEIQTEKELRAVTGADFPLIALSGFSKKHLPSYAPTMVGVSHKGKVMFTLPGVPGEKEYLRIFLESFYAKMYPRFLEEKTRK